MSRVPDPMIEMFVRFTHLDKEYSYLPGMSASAMASLLGVSDEVYQQERARLDALALGAAEELLTDDGFAALVARLPFADGQTVVALGDSITDDLCGWFVILRHLLEIRGDAPKMVNLAQAAYTSAMGLRRSAAQLTYLRPEWVFCMLGSADMSTVNGSLQTSLAETERQLLAIRSLGGDARWVWLSPPPVDEERVRAFEPFARGLAAWANKDLTALGGRIHAFPDPAVDVQAVYGVPPNPEYLGPDGVHPTLAGQQATARAVVERLSEVERLP
jgi:lysophospholipase L1-like esterase